MERMGGKPGAKICPLQTSGTVNFDCVREKCEWWIPEAGQCAVTLTARKNM